ncbi:hypothetical protein C3F09_12920, partial [candidate division GN15 bacterium]
MTKAQLTAVLAGAILITVGAVSSVSAGDTVKHSITFATYASDGDDLYWALVLAESIRDFGGSLSDAPIWVHLNDAAPELDTMYAPRRDSLKVAIGHSHTPEGMQKIIYSGKVYASATAEKKLAGTTAILAWLDPDVIFVKEPKAFMLGATVALGYRPVQLVNISSPYSEPLNEFWAHLYQDLGVVDSQIYPMTTTTDMVQIRAHFNAGMLIVRPERGILQSWPLALEKVWADPAIQRMCS